MPKTQAAKMKIDGLPVKNLTRPITLEISEQDCKRGNQREPGSCAAALALIREYPNCTEARVHLGRVFLKIGNRHWLRGKTTGALRTEIAAFDKGGTFDPGTYKINPLPPSELRDLLHSGGAKSKSAKKGKKAKTRVMHFTRGVRGNAHGEYRRAKNGKLVSASHR